MKRRNMKGFTLVELLIVLLILGILIGLAVPRYLQAVESSKQRTFCANVRSIISAIETWRMDTGTSGYPDAGIVTASIMVEGSKYFSQLPRNPYTGTKIMIGATATTGVDVVYTGTVGGYSIQIEQKGADGNPIDCGIK